MRLQVFLLTALAVSTSSTFAQAPPLELTLDWKAIGEQIVERLDLQPGEKVVALAHPGTFREVIPHFRYAVMKSGAIDLGIVDALEQPIPSDWDLSLLTPALWSAREAYRDMFREVDASVMLPGAIPTQPAYAAIQDLLQEGRGRTIHFHWLQNRSAVAIPGQPLPRRWTMEETYQNALLNVDYRALDENQQRFEAAMRSGEVRVTSPLGTDLRFRIGQRPVSLQNGDASRDSHRSRDRAPFGCGSRSATRGNGGRHDRVSTLTVGWTGGYRFEAPLRERQSCQHRRRQRSRSSGGRDEPSWKRRAGLS